MDSHYNKIGDDKIFYTVEIRGLDNIFSTDVECDGSDPAIRDTLECTIPMQNLWKAPHSLPYDKIIGVRVAASTIHGQGWFSPLNTQEKIRTKPGIMTSLAKEATTNS